MVSSSRPAHRAPPIVLRALGKAFLRQVGKFLVSCDLAWKTVGEKLTRFGLYLASQRDAEERDRIVQRHAALAEALEPGRVLYGPFAGLDYHGVEAFCSAKYPKLLGTYEFELHPALERLLADEYEGFVNIGAADGYYAVGLARRFPGKKVIAFEAEPRGAIHLERLATLNAVESHLEIRGRCEYEDLLSLPFARALVVMDCEGFEATLISRESARRLARSSLLIETHDGYFPQITRRLADILQATHEVEIIEACQDLDRPDLVSPLEILNDLTRQEVSLLLAETRTHACLRWLVARPKTV